MSVLQPSLRFLFKNPAHFVALGAGSGLFLAPGTIGTLFSWVSYNWFIYPKIQFRLDDWVFASTFLFISFVLGWICTHYTSKKLVNPDHGSIVIDEIVAFWMILMIIPHHFWWQFWAFMLFRLFDIKKPAPINWIESRFKGAFGVMIDDTIAAFFSLLVLAVVYQLS
jgi:phosphatidylglycerophosphatase A